MLKGKKFDAFALAAYRRHLACSFTGSPFHSFIKGFGQGIGESFAVCEVRRNEARPKVRW